MDKPIEETSEYTKPEVADYGDLLDLTAGNKTGNFLDATFPIHTPKKNLTFSG